MVATQAIPPLVSQALTETLVGSEAQSASLPVDIGNPSFVSSESDSIFDYMAPGIFAFGAIFLILTVAESLSFDREEGLLRRINTTPLTSSEFMSSQTISNMVMALIQVSVIFIMAFVVGYSPDTGVAGIAMAFIIVLVFALCCIGFGLIAATLAKSAGAATGISFIFIMPMMFLGTFVTASAPSATTEVVGKAVPSYYVTDALTNLFLRGASPTSSVVITDLVIVSIFSAIVLIIGIVLFKKFGNK
jgi:ABC-type multidrug transport system permease subunit